MKNYKLFCFFTLFFFSLFSAFAAGKKDVGTEELVSGNVKFVFYKQSGNFCLYRLSEIGRDNWIPLYDDRALATTNQYSILVNNKIYTVKRKSGKLSMTVTNENNRIAVVYPLNSILSVSQTFYFLPPSPKDNLPVLCIETNFENTTGSSIDAGIKALFDTQLGEKQRIPLYTDTMAILGETRIDVANLKPEYLASANSIAGCMFFLDKNKEPDIAPNEIFVANWDYLQTMRWTPTVKEGRSFSTKYYNNDSAVLFVWPTKRLNLNEVYTVKTYIGYYDYLHRAVPKEALEQHLKTLSDKDRKNYDDILYLLKQIEEVKAHPENYSDERILELTNAVDEAMKKLQ